MPSVNTNENDPMNWSWTTPRVTTTPKQFPRTRPMQPQNCAARAKYYMNRGLVVPPIFANCAPKKRNRVNNNNTQTQKRTRVTNRINRSQNAYAVLGVPKDSSRSVVRKAYLRLSKQYHPNKGGNANTFRKIKNAYNSLL